MTDKDWLAELRRLAARIERLTKVAEWARASIDMHQLAVTLRDAEVQNEP